MGNSKTASKPQEQFRNHKNSVKNNKLTQHTKDLPNEMS